MLERTSIRPSKLEMRLSKGSMFGHHCEFKDSTVRRVHQQGRHAKGSFTAAPLKILGVPQPEGKGVSDPSRLPRATARDVSTAKQALFLLWYQNILSCCSVVQPKHHLVIQALATQFSSGARRFSDYFTAPFAVRTLPSRSGIACGRNEGHPKHTCTIFRTL